MLEEETKVKKYFQETIPAECIEYEWWEDKVCPRSHLSGAPTNQLS